MNGSIHTSLYAKGGLLWLVFVITINCTSYAQYNKLLDFDGSNGNNPKGSLISDGTFLYGMTSVGGANDAGIIFKILPDGTGFVNIHDFDGNAFGNGGYPQECSLIYNGTFLYGMTNNGGANAQGGIFKISPDGTGYVTLHEFGGSGDGFEITKSLFTDGTFLYGMTHFGGANNNGIIFKIKNDGTGYIHLLDFDGLNGSFPEGSLISDGTFLYGMATRGGTNSAGTIFKILPDGSGYSQLHEFGGTGDGSLPGGALVSVGSFLYGTTSDAGANNRGSIFRIKTDGSGYLKIYDFKVGNDGNYPYGSLISDGTFLYGMTSRGGVNDEGTIFKILTDGTNYLKLFEFDNSNTGRYPTESLISVGSSLYGMTPDGGTNGLGTVFKYSMASLVPAITNFTPTSGPAGTTVTITGTNFSTTPANNIVYFGSTKATVTAATSTQLTVTVPAGATYQPITVNVAGSTAYSATPFVVTFCGTPGITTSSFAAPVKLATETSSGPVSVFNGDLDGDGKPDLVVANRFANTVSVFKNISSGAGDIAYAPKIDLAIGFEPISISIGDLDGDGKSDLAVAIFGEFKVSVFLNTSSGPGSISFASKVDFLTGPAGAGPFSVAVGDLDNDGKSDLAVANLLNHQVSVLRNISSGVGNINFAARIDLPTGAGSGPISVSIRDLDGDGKVDLVSTNTSNNKASVFRNTSSGPGVISYAPRVDLTTGTEPRAVYIGDLDSDGKADLAVANSSASNSVSVFRNTSNAGSISFALKQDFTTSNSPWDVAIADLDGDGKIDLVAADGSGFASILRNTSTGAGNVNFDSHVDFLSGTNPVSVSVGDFDLDGKNDLALTNYNGDDVSLFRNTSSSPPAFTVSSFTPTSGPVGTVVTFTGTNFSTTPLNNIIKFNGVVAFVTASNSTSITAIVPAGATTGPTSIEIGCGAAFSIIPFTVTGGASITITTQPSDFIACAGVIATFNALATGTTNITYQWQFSPDGVVPFTDLVNNANYSGVTTTMLSINTAGNFGVGRYRCRINGDVAPTVFTNDEGLFITTGCNNIPPIINTVQLSTVVSGKITVDLLPLIVSSGTLDVNSIQVLVQPTSGANALVVNGILTIDYAGIAFSGDESITIEACDTDGLCAQQIFAIEVASDIIIYNAVSPNEDGLNEIFRIKNIDLIPETQNNKVSIYNRWGSKVFEVENYNNNDRVFKGLNDNGNELTSGTYFYKIEFMGSGKKSITGYLLLKK